MKTPLVVLIAVSQLSACCHSGEVERSDRHRGLSSPRLDGYSGASIGESFVGDDLLYVELRAARGDGMTAATIRIEGVLRLGLTYDSQALDGLSDLRLVQGWRPHIGEWDPQRRADRVVLQVEPGPRNDLIRVSFAAYFGQSAPSRGSFLVSRPRLAK